LNALGEINKDNVGRLCAAFTFPIKSNASRRRHWLRRARCSLASFPNTFHAKPSPPQWTHTPKLKAKHVRSEM
jgi:hypothetical protein